jgi:AcrR family transcriptional regulator
MKQQVPNLSMTTLRRDAGRPRGEPVERAILRAALDDLSRHGVEGVSVDRVAHAAEVNKTTVYRRWATVELLVEAALQFAVTLVSVPPIEAGSIESGLRSLVATAAALLSSEEGQAIARAGMSPQVNQRAASLVASAAVMVPDELLELIDDATERGEWNPDVSGVVVVAAVLGSAIHRSMIERQPLDDEWSEQLVSLLQHGVSRPPHPAN